LFRGFVFSLPWPPARSLRLGECDMTNFYCSLREIPIMSYLPNSYKVRSGPGVSGFPPLFGQVVWERFVTAIKIDLNPSFDTCPPREDSIFIHARAWFDTFQPSENLLFNNLSYPKFLFRLNRRRPAAAQNTDTSYETYKSNAIFRTFCIMNNFSPSLEKNSFMSSVKYLFSFFHFLRRGRKLENNSPSGQIVLNDTFYA
jgi:hypothetical protein